MMKWTRFVAMALVLGLAAIGCSRNENVTAPPNEGASAYTISPDQVHALDKNGTEALGAPSIPIATGSGVAEGGVGMVEKTSGTLDINVPAGATIKQALLYWAGGTTAVDGDDAITVDGTDVKGELIGGPTNFFSNYWFSAYRADITDLGLVSPGANSLTITGFDFDFSAGSLDENDGCSVVVIYDDGTTADISFVDGLDMAYFNFTPTLNATVPQTFTFAPEPVDRTADLMILAASVGADRPNQVKVTTSAGEQIFDGVLGSFDELLWDSMILPVTVPAGDTALTVELVSVPSMDPRGASMAWVGSALSVPVTPPDDDPGCTRTIGYWKNHAGFGPQDDVLTPLLPIWLGTPDGANSIQVTDAAQAVELFKTRRFGGHRNGIAKLYAQLLAAKLNIANGADDEAIAGTIAKADAFLADHDSSDWRHLRRAKRHRVLRWKTRLDRYNNGEIGPGHCDDDHEGWCGRDRS